MVRLGKVSVDLFFPKCTCFLVLHFFGNYVYDQLVCVIKVSYVLRNNSLLGRQTWKSSKWDSTKKNRSDVLAEILYFLDVSKKGAWSAFPFPFPGPFSFTKGTVSLLFIFSIFFGLYSKLRFCGAKLLNFAQRCFIALLDEIRDSSSMGLNLGIPSA